jgi:hypothetical protein
LDRGPRRVEVALPEGYALSPGLRNSIEAMAGVAEVQDEENTGGRWSRPSHLNLASTGAAR